MSEYEALDYGFFTGKSIIATEGLKECRRACKKQAKKSGGAGFRVENGINRRTYFGLLPPNFLEKRRKGIENIF